MRFEKVPFPDICYNISYISEVQYFLSVITGTINCEDTHR